MTNTPSRTSLFSEHVAAGGRLVDFAGWEMPVQYTSILDEHRAVRSAVGMFDISHMGEFFVSGPAATAWLDSLLTNSVTSLEVGTAQYTLLLNEQGGVIDDLILYRLGEAAYLLIVNAAKINEDAEWMRARLVAEGVEFADRSGELSAVAVQGPNARAAFERISGQSLPDERNRVIEVGFEGASGYVATTGYTGEDGFEWIIPNDHAVALWRAFLQAGVKPCGLGARDTLRLEMAYPLNGSDLSPEKTPLEAGLGFFVQLDKGEFVGRDALLAQKSVGLPTRLVALEVVGKSPPVRPHYPVRAEGKVVSETTSGALSPSLSKSIALAYLPTPLAKIGTAVEIDVRGRLYPASIIRKPFFKRQP